MSRRRNVKTRAQAPAMTEPVMIEQLVTPEARKHGDYRIETLSVIEGELSKGEKGERSVVKNRSVDVVQVWADKGALDDRQLAAIARYRRIHHLVFGMPAQITADWSKFISGCSRGGVTLEDMVADKIEAKDDLERLSVILFRKAPPYVESTWLNAVVHNLAAGPAGSLLGHKTERETRVGTLTIVRFVADTLAMEWGF